MKNSFVLFMLLTLFITGQSFALIGLRVGANANITQPTATIAFGEATDGKTFNPTGFGVTGFAMADIILLKVTADVGYINFGEESYSYDLPLGGVADMDNISASANVKAVPIMIGLRWEFGLPIGPKLHIGAQAGVHNFTYTYSGTAVDMGYIEKEQTESKFSVSPIVGLRWSALEASLLYMIVEDFNYVGLRVGYTFGFGI